MDNKKTFILGLLVIAALAGLVWYTSQHKEQIFNQAASVLGNKQEELNQTAIIDELITGDPKAPVTMIDYSSHFCGHCANFHSQTLPLLTDKYVKTGQLKIIHRFLSPSELSIAVFCAYEQGSFSKYNDYLFEHNSELKEVNDLKIIASQLELNQEQFNQCFDSEKYKAKVEEWFKQAQEAGVEGTPTFLINGEKIVGNQPYAVFEETIDKALSQSQ